MSGAQSDRGRGRGRGRGLPFHPRGQGRGGQGGQNRGAGWAGRPGRGRDGPVQEIFSHADVNTLPQASGEIRQIEDRIEATCRSLSPAESKKVAEVQRMPLRPGYGTQGKQVLLWANYFQLVASPASLLFRYSVEVLPDNAGMAPKGRKLRRIVELLLEEHFSAHRSGIATDYKANLIARSQLPLQAASYEIRYRSEGEDTPSGNVNTYRVRVQHTGTLSMSQLLDHLSSTQASALFRSKAELIQALNIVVGHHPKTASNIVSVGANRHFDISPANVESIDLGAGLKAIRGFWVSVRAATARLLVNVQIKNIACYNEGPLGQLMLAFFAENGRNFERLDGFLQKVRIQVTHIRNRNKKGQVIPRIKTIAGLATRDDGDGSPNRPVVRALGAGAKMVEFFPNTHEQRPGESRASYISVYDHFRRNHNTTVQDPQMPVVNVGTRQKPSYLPVDVCTVLPGQPSIGRLSPGQTRHMIRFAVRKPAQNAQSIVTKGAQILGLAPPTNVTLNEFHIGVTPQLIVVPGRVLKGPDVKYKNNKIASTRFGSWNMQSIQFSTGTQLLSWTYLVISLPDAPDAFQNPQQLATTLDAFTAKLKELGIDANACTPGRRIRLTGPTNDADIEKAIQGLMNDASQKAPKLLLVILPDVSTAIYNRVKLVCDVKVGLRNICVVGHKFAKRENDQYLANVGLKFNLKLGGHNQILDNSKLGVISEGKTMVVGIDVTHPSPGSSSKAPSVAAIVASVDPLLAQWPADLRIQKAREEMVADLKGMLKSRLRLWAQKNKNAYPENLLIYRDGVSEGQYHLVLDKELPLLQQACTEVYPASDTKRGLPRMSIIIVGKRHNTRFYPTKREEADRSLNPQNGTVVDRGVTEARNWDFFLQAHSAIQGTARPAHYYIVLDEIFRDRKVRLPFQNTADALEDLTHNMCYLFGRATKAVSICPAAYYADLACERARCYLSQLFDATSGATPAASVVEGSEPAASSSDVRVHPNVQDTMFYI